MYFYDNISKWLTIFILNLFIWKIRFQIYIWALCKNQNKKSNAIPRFVLEFYLFILEIHVIQENAITLFKNAFFYSIIIILLFYLQIAIVINTLTTMNNQFETLIAPKINITFIILFLTYTTISLSLSLQLHPKIPTYLLQNL